MFNYWIGLCGGVQNFRQQEDPAFIRMLNELRMVCAQSISWHAPTNG